MASVYVTEYGAVVGKRDGRLTVSLKHQEKLSMPFEQVDGIFILGNAMLTSQAHVECLSRGICVTFLSKGGRYFGRLVSTGHVNTSRQRLQCELYRDTFALSLSKSIVTAKVHNQSAVLYRVVKSSPDGTDVTDARTMLKQMEDKASRATDLDELLGCEGFAAKAYFHGISECLPDAFKFKGRSKRPPLDPFNSMLSFGYTLLLYDVYAMLESRGMNPYFGFYHQDAERHPTLASDLMEEWRAPLVDSLVIGLIRRHEIQPYMFEQADDGGIYMNKDGLTVFINGFQRKLDDNAGYLYGGQDVSYRDAVTQQVNSLVQAVEARDASIYRPVRIR